MIRRLWVHRADPTPAAPNSATGEPQPRLGPFSLRLATAGPEDRALLRAAYASSRDDDPELSRRHPESRQAVIEHEFESRQLCYPVDFPDVEFFLLSLDDSPAGRVYLQATPSSIFIVDLVLLPAFRGRGHGTALLRDVIDLAHTSGRTVRLHVAKNNPRAAALYQRLGFVPVGELAQHLLLERPPASLNSSVNS